MWSVERESTKGKPAVNTFLFTRTRKTVDKMDPTTRAQLGYENEPVVFIIGREREISYYL
jgi:hypothetical protein